MVEALEYLSEAALAQPAHDLEPVREMASVVGDVFVLVIIETVVIHTVRSGWRALILLPLL